jgi:phosphomannomutase
MAGIFKAYDIRGIYRQTLTDDLAYKIGRAFATYLKCRKVVVGQDMRPHSTPLFNALARGLTEQGVDVIHLGLCSTPMSYFANGKLGADGGIMITASHNPGEWNGFKLCRQQAIPISGDTGIRDIEKIVNASSFAAPAPVPGHISEINILPEYVKHIQSRVALSRPVHIAADFANAMGILEARCFDGLIQVDPLFDTLDGTFPHHEANPLNTDTLKTLQTLVRSKPYDFGVAFDGDADRAGFIDEQGSIIPMDLITALIAQSLLAQTQGAIFYDLRSSWIVKEVIQAAGGKPMMSRVGHAFIKQQMRDADALFAGELSGHYYFKDNYFTESSALAVFCIADILCRTGRPLSELIRPLRKYHASGEINSEVENTAQILATLRKRYADGRISELDGYSVEYADWWFNVRVSNTEPLIRLNLEARSDALMKQKRDEILAVIRGH